MKKVTSTTAKGTAAAKKATKSHKKVIDYNGRAVKSGKKS